MGNKAMLKLIFLGGFIISPIAGLCFLLLFLLAVVYAQDDFYARNEAIAQALLLPGSGLFISAVIAVACYIVPGKLGLYEE